MKKSKTLEDQLFDIGLVFFFLFLAGFLLYKIFLKSVLPVRPCLFSTFLGIYCPGCGGTRAVDALLQGHFLKALWYHPLVPYTAVLYGGFMAGHAFSRLGSKKIHGWKFHNWYLYAAVGIVVANFIVKNVLRIGFGIYM